MYITKEITTLSNNNAANGTLRLTFEVVQQVVERQSYVRLYKAEFSSSSRTGTYYGDGAIKIGADTQVTYTSSGDASVCYVSALNTYEQIGYTLDGGYTIIQHDLSGNGSFNLVLGPRSGTGYNDFNIFYLNSTTYNAHITAQTISVALPQIQDSAAVATPLSPVNTVEDGSALIFFTWDVSNDSGTTQTGSDLQYSTDNATWTALAAISGSGTITAVAANTFSGGTVYWRVRAYNRDGVAGDWSASVTFIVVAAPAAPDVFSDNAPFATITWQSVGQQAYRLTVDGKSYGPYFGTAKTFTLPDYLADGEHTVSVEIQGSYGLWSQPGSVTFTVANVPGDALTLSGAFGIDAALSWTTASTVDDYLVYRDGVQIGHTTGKAFTDRLSLGSHSYVVVNRLADGNYTKSAAVTGVTAVESVAVAALSGGAWVNLRLTEKSDSEQTFGFSRNYSLRHFAGADYPIAEMSPYRDLSGSYDCAFVTDAEAAPLLALLGSTVIVKSRGANVVVGPFAAVEKRRGDFYVAYRFSIPAAHYEDHVDATD